MLIWYIDKTSWDIMSLGTKCPETKCTVDRTSCGQNV
jgi:hypothetical protein